MGKVLCYVYDEMADFETTLCTHILGMYGKKEIVAIAYSKDVVTSKPGMTYYPKATVLEALEYDDVEALIIPGGWNREQKDELTRLIQKLYGENKLIAAICAAPQFLARAGLLEKHKYTTTLTAEYMVQLGEKDDFPRDNYVKEKVVRDENIITAVGNAFVDFAVEVADWFKLFANEEEKSSFAEIYKGN